MIKHYFDGYLKKGKLPPMIDKRVEGKLQDPFQERYYHKIDDEYGFYGKLDDCIVDGDCFIKPYLKPPGVSPREVVSSRILAFTSKMEE